MTKENLPKILIVDDDAEIRSQLKWALNNQYQLYEAEEKEEAVKIAREITPDLISLDITLGRSGADQDGLELLRYFLQEDPYTKVVMVTGNDEKLLALEALKNGAFDYYQKPIDIHELRIIFQRALYIQELERENQRLQGRLKKKKVFQEIIGESPQMRKIFATVQKVATTDATVLITGESGTGKELVARAIHNLSPRKNQPFVAINCGAIPENLLESELFGHEKGAFTGAYYRKIGKFEDADNGTIFLDEIGDLSAPLQVKLLRFLQERLIERVGGRAPISVDVRIIAASNKNLEEEVANNNFREDLFYRLGVILISLPPLRERGDDVLYIAHHYLNQFNTQYDKRILGFSDKAELAIKKYPWPGNVRELENKVKRAVIMTNDKYINANDLQLKDIQTLARVPHGLKGILDEVERRTLIEALEDFSGNISKAARFLDISRACFYDLLKKHEIDRKRYKR